jgi:chaperonin cofactor prefoldin
MEETLKLILNKLDTMESSINHLKEGQSRLEGKVNGLEKGQEVINDRLDKIDNKIENRFNQVLNEIQYLYDGMDKRITALEAKV